MSVTLPWPTGPVLGKWYGDSTQTKPMRAYRPLFLIAMDAKRRWQAARSTDEVASDVHDQLYELAMAVLTTRRLTSRSVTISQWNEYVAAINTTRDLIGTIPSHPASSDVLRALDKLDAYAQRGIAFVEASEGER